MSHKGMQYDNAVMESFFNPLNRELADHGRFSGFDETKRKLFDHIEVMHEPQPLHDNLGYRKPVQQERMARAS